MIKAPWETFLRSKISEILSPGSLVVDIGGGLRALKKKGNRFAKDREWAAALIGKCDYKVLDPVPDYSPDIVGDIHKLPFKDNSVDSFICMAVLEHVEDPLKAISEMHRSLKPGGRCFIYIPFLFYYHAEKGYYHDYWRFTKDAIERILFKQFSKLELVPVRGALETWVHLSPLGRYKGLLKVCRFFDGVLGKLSTNQASGYNIYLVK